MARSNVRRLRPKEVAIVSELLAQEADDIEELAKAIVRALNKYRAEEPLFVRAVKANSGTVVLYGPYPNGKDALEDDQSHGTGRVGTPYEVMLFSLVPPYGQPMWEVDPASQISLDEVE